MIFHRRLPVIILTAFALCVYCFISIKNHSFHLNILILLLYSAGAAALLSTYHKVENRKITKYIFFTKEYEILIKDIHSIEAITSKQYGVIYIRIGKSPTEDYYKIRMKDKTSYTIDRFYVKNGQSLGRYLTKEYKIHLKEKDKMTFLGNDI